MSFRNLDLNLLRVFDEVMAEKNFSRAAHNLAMTQPAVSNAIQRLRDTLSDTLFVRVATGVKPTPLAERIWPIVREALTSLQANLLPDDYQPLLARDNFRLAMADATAAMLIPALVPYLQAEAPGVTLRILPLTTRDPRQLLDQDSMDIAIGYFPTAVAAMNQNDQHSFVHQRMYDGEYVVVMRKDHPLASRELTLDAFCSATHLLVSFSGRPFGFVDEALASVGRKRRILLTVNQFFTAGRVVTESDLLTVLPRHFVPATGFANQVAVRPIPLNLEPVHVEMLWHNRHKRSPSQVWLRDVITRASQRVLDSLKD
jgi:DNA-binding transcriptional LysR family regulator